MGRTDTHFGRYPKLFNVKTGGAYSYSFNLKILRKHFKDLYNSVSDRGKITLLVVCLNST